MTVDTLKSGTGKNTLRCRVVAVDGELATLVMLDRSGRQRGKSWRLKRSFLASPTCGWRKP